MIFRWLPIAFYGWRAARGAIRDDGSELAIGLVGLAALTSMKRKFGHGSKSLGDVPDRLFHVGHLNAKGGVSARPFPSTAARRSETQALIRDLEADGFNAPHRVVWLSANAPVSVSVPWVEVNPRRLNLRRLVPTFQTGGYFLYVGAIPASAILRHQPSNRHAR